MMTVDITSTILNSIHRRQQMQSPVCSIPSTFHPSPSLSPALSPSSSSSMDHPAYDNGHDDDPSSDGASSQQHDHSMLPWWFGNEEKSHLRHVLAQYHSMLMIDTRDKRTLHSIRPTRFIGRIKRQYPKYRWVEAADANVDVDGEQMTRLSGDDDEREVRLERTFETIDEINIYERGPVPDWSPILQLKTIMWTRTQWNICDGTIISTVEIEDTDCALPQRLRSQCTFKFSEEEDDDDDDEHSSTGDTLDLQHHQAQGVELDCRCNFYIYAIPAINKVNNPRRSSPRNLPRVDQSFSPAFVEEGDEYIFFASTERFLVGYSKNNNPLEYLCVQRCFPPTIESKTLEDEDEIDNEDDIDSDSPGRTHTKRRSSVIIVKTRCEEIDAAPEHLRGLLENGFDHSPLGSWHTEEHLFAESDDIYEQGPEEDSFEEGEESDEEEEESDGESEESEFDDSDEESDSDEEPNLSRWKWSSRNGSSSNSRR